jgi:hypothetical protein
VRNIVVFDEYGQVDLKPSKLLDEYIRLSEKDVFSLLIKDKKLESCACPGCALSESSNSFEKFGLTYHECSSCGTLYVSPRPVRKAINEYYLYSSARKFWRDELSRATEEKRRQKIIKPRFDWVVDSTREYLPGAKHLVDVNTVQYEYVQEMALAGLFEKKTLLNPYLDLSRRKLPAGIEKAKNAGDELNLKAKADAILLFEVIDRAFSVDDILGRARKLLNPGGLVFITAILASGFDLQILRESAENLYPPDRMNVFTVEGMKMLYERNGFECMEFSTPGILDVEIVRDMARRRPDIKMSKFMKYVLKSRGQDVRSAFQEFLQANLLSSYGRIIIRKKGD